MFIWLWTLIALFSTRLFMHGTAVGKFWCITKLCTSKKSQWLTIWKGGVAVLDFRLHGHIAKCCIMCPQKKYGGETWTELCLGSLLTTRRPYFHTEETSQIGTGSYNKTATKFIRYCLSLQRSLIISHRQKRNYDLSFTSSTPETLALIASSVRHKLSFCRIQSIHQKQRWTNGQNSKVIFSFVNATKICQCAI